MQDSLKIKTTLDEVMLTSDDIFIVAHNRPDFDAIGAMIGMGLICKKNNKQCYLIVDDDISKLDKETSKIIENVKESFNIIKSKDAPTYMNKKSSLIIVDANKNYLLSENTRGILPIFKDIIIIDHHKTDENTIKTKYTFVDEKLSSTCEEVSRLLFSYGVKISPEYANYLLAGIILDTNKFTKNASGDTFTIVSKLISKGADATIANNMFLEDYESDRKMLRIVNNSTFPTFAYAIACDDEEDRIYTQEDIAKAADYLLKYQVNATFAFGFIDEETIHISARSKGSVDVSSIMKLFDGGGNDYSAAAKVKGCTLKEVKEMLNKALNPSTYLDTNVSLIEEDKPKILKLK